MADVRVGARPTSAPSQTTAKAGVSEQQLRNFGLDPKQLFGWAPVAYRRIEKVTASHVEVDGGKVPRSVLKAPVTEGQWLRFDQDQAGTIGVSVDLKATLRAESRLTDLFQTLKR